MQENIEIPPQFPRNRIVVMLEGEQESESVGERGLSSKKLVPLLTVLGTVDEQELTSVGVMVISSTLVALSMALGMVDE